MKVKCIEKPDTFFPITVGKIYDVVEDLPNYYRVINDNGVVEGFYKERFEVLEEVIHIPPIKITYKDFLASMPKSASACVTMYGDGEVIANVYGFEFVCKTEERAEEVYAALITLFKEGI